ncbi:HlyD family efflux transporter periplasmic adaptor subunit [Shumkonia mesophila]|uniref:HlyD family efflux transporter periplasmic adaptor subunit n=1 Tax=Shumkonia mesophila TaxID=2838854 RepID=UPI002934988E|nr:HlyD family efflux transporter periplasmic adaptor subunit [Shumkonia mesophila]
MKKLIVLVVIVVAAASAGYVYYARPWQERPATETGIVLQGNIDIREADLAFNVGGRVESVEVEEGTTVGKGQLLATLDAATYMAEVDAAEAQVAAQKAVLDRLLAGSRSQEIQKARADVAAIQADLEDALSTLKRTQKLAREDFASQQKLDSDRARVDGAKARLKAAEQALDLAIQGPRNEDIVEARAQMEAQKAALALAMQRLDYTRLLAPAGGIVKTRIVEPGAVVLAQTPVYVLALTDPVWARTYVAGPDLGRVYPGMKAELFTDSTPGKAYAGWVGHVSPVAEFTPKTVETREIRSSLVYRVRVYVGNPDNGLRQGMPVTIRLKPDAAPSAPETPKGAS